MSAIDDSLEQLRQAPPSRFWRSLGELSQSDRFRASLENEFPELAARFNTAVDRRTALKMLGASLLISGLAACKGAEHIAPYVIEPEHFVPGKARYYATTLDIDGFGVGALAETHEGRPTKIEGNPRHPASLGGTDAIMQASVFSLYDPDRSRVPLQGGVPASWSAFQAAMAALREAHAAGSGAGLGVVIGAETSPTLQRQLTALQGMFPAMRLYRDAPTAPRGLREAMAAHSGRADLQPVYDFSQVDAVVSLGADIVGEGPGKLAYARQIADLRRVRRNGNRTMLGLHVAETLPSLTGAAADSRQLLNRGEMDALAQELLGGNSASPLGQLLQGGRTLVVAGEAESPRVQLAALELNQRNGLVGRAVRYIASPLIEADGAIADLVDDVLADRVTSLVVLGPDLVHTAPQGVDIAQALQRLNQLIHLGTHIDETARLAHWHVPATHALESWSDARAYDGTASIVQPMIAPLYDAHTPHEVLATLLGDFSATPLQLVRESWRGLDADQWHDVLRQGVVPGTTAESIGFTPKTAPLMASEDTATASLELITYPDPWLRDGRNAANLWLLELPRPLTKLVWGNAAEMGIETAADLGVAQGDLVAVARGDETVELPVFVQPGLPRGVIAVALGFGRPVTHGNEVVGVNAFRLRRAGDGARLDGVSVRKLDGRGRIITTQEHHAMAGRELVKVLPIAALDDLAEEEEELPTLYPEHPNPEEAWGMSIDLNTCIGCMACVSACQAENNTPTVGPDEMERGHDMHWLRVDRYYGGDPAEPETVFQPVPCMQCEDAPCEVVCPVNATVHTHDGLNAQVYNRCIGTRYCSQNCPYKVRRFNWFDYQKFDESSPLSLLMNPDVTVRERGVMEKCTYCVQRIAAARIESEIGDTGIPDGAVQPACAQACPTQAITFGNIKDPNARVTREKAEPQSYTLLEELNTRPRTTYLARLTAEGKDG